MATISVEQWLAELERLQREGGQADGMTTEEIGEAIDRSGTWVRQHILRPAKKQGRLSVGSASREGIDGKPYKATVYAILPAAKAKARA